MTLRDWADIGQLVGGIGVIASLVYLAVQVRANTRQAREQNRAERMGAFAAVTEGAARFRMAVIQNAEVASIYRRGRAGEGLDADEALRFETLLIERLYLTQVLFVRSLEVPGEEHVWGGISHLTLDLLRQPGVAPRYPGLRMMLRADFRAALDRLMEESGAAAARAAAG